MSVETVTDDPLRTLFKSLSAIWFADTGIMSSIAMIEKHPCYSDLVDLGEPILPFIFEALKQEGSPHYFLLLRKITNENPIQEQNRGYIALMTSDWLIWGNSKGLC